MYRTKSLVAALVLVTFVAFCGQSTAHAWGGHHGHHRHGSSWIGGLAGAAIGTAIVASAYRHASYEAPVRYAPESYTTSYVDAYGRLVIVRNVYDPYTGRWYRYAEYAR